MKNLIKAVLAVMEEVKSIGKWQTVWKWYNSYKWVADKDVKQVIWWAMQKHWLIILPTWVEEDTETRRREEDYQGKVKQKQSILTKVKTTYLLMHESGESVELAGYGHGVDSQDKGAGKATTYALKHTLLYMFLTPTWDIDDADTTHSEEVPKPKVKPKFEPKTENWSKALDLKATVETIKKHYTISKTNEAIYIETLAKQWS